VHEFMKNKDLEDTYIRKIGILLIITFILFNQINKQINFLNFLLEFFHNGQILIVCMRKEQSFALLDSFYLEIDMSFKRIQGGIKEWELVAYVENLRKSMYDIFKIITVKFNYHNY